MSTMSDTPTKFLLAEDRIPTHWVNLLPDLPGEPLPPLHPGTMQPAGPPDLTPIFPMALIEQEVASSPEVEIPDEVRDAYRLWRPTPLYRARRLERALDKPAHIYYKYEGASPAGSPKPKTAAPRPHRESRTPPARRRSPTPRPASRSSPPRPAPASGARRSRSPASCSASSARSSWSAPPTTRSPTAGR